MPTDIPGTEPPQHRALKAVVIGLGVLLMLAFAGLVGTMVYRLTHPSEAPAPTASEKPSPGASPGFADLRLPLDQGWRLAGTSIGDGKLVVRLERLDGPGGKLMIFDLSTGAGLGTIEFLAQP